jgi:hypothetical protein
VPSHVLARMATTGIYLLHGIPRDVQQAARVRAVREETTLRAVLLRALNEYAAGAWPPGRKEESASRHNLPVLGGDVVPLEVIAERGTLL